MNKLKMQKPQLKDGQEEFHKYHKGLENGVFSSVVPDKEEKLSAVERQKRTLEAKSKEKEEWTRKLVVDDPNLHVSLRPIGLAVTDKYKSLLADPANRVGLKLPAKYLKDKVVKRDEAVQQLPISFNLEEEKLDRHLIEKRLRLDRKFDPKASMSKNDFDTLRAKNADSFVHKPMRQDVFTEK